MLHSEHNTRPLTDAERTAYTSGADMDVNVVYVNSVGYRVAAS